MKKILGVLTVIFVLGFSGAADATPSTQIWIPSTDIQGFLVPHFGVDTYNTLGEKSIPNGGKGFNTINYGLTVGISPPGISDKIGIEVGVDYRDVSGDSENPWYWNAKLGLAEGAFGDISPAIAVGAYDMGNKDGVNDYNIVYGLVARTFGELGRLSVGGFSGNDKLLLDGEGKKDNSGVLASWDKAINDKWWVAADYMGGKSGYGALTLGFCYYILPSTSFIVGYDIYNNSDIKPTLTFQLDINFDGLTHPHHAHKD
ncbi:MAG: hypothetical protein HZB29_07850 [Nitrospinae bacterium]|nr:hypothetical protein [Nitrospinota bacterium]